MRNTMSFNNGRLHVMIRTTVTAILVLCSGLAYGGWVSLGGDEKLGMTIYIDPATINRQGELARIGILYDFKTAQTKEGGISFHSATMQREYDCAKERTRLLEITKYSDQMGNGQILSQSSLDEQEWEPVGPLESGTIAKDLWTLACR
jgi:hypothetical protein